MCVLGVRTGYSPLKPHYTWDIVCLGFSLPHISLDLEKMFREVQTEAQARMRKSMVEFAVIMAMSPNPSSSVFDTLFVMA